MAFICLVIFYNDKNLEALSQTVDLIIDIDYFVSYDLSIYPSRTESGEKQGIRLKEIMEADEERRIYRTKFSHYSFLWNYILEMS